MGFIYMIVGTIAALVGIDSLHLNGNFTNMVNIIKTRFTAMGTDDVLMVIFFFVMWLAGVASFIYVRRSLLEFKLRAFLSLIAPFLLLFMNLLVAVLIFVNISFAQGITVNFRAELIGSLNWVGWVGISIMGISVICSAAGIAIMLKGAFAPVAITENEFMKAERKEKEKADKKKKKEKEKDRKKNKTDYIMPTQARASREKIDESEMMFKSGDNSEEDEALAAALASRRKNPFLKEEDKKDEKKEEKKEPETNANGVSMEVIKENPLLDGPALSVEQAWSPNISANAEPEPEPEPEPEEKKEDPTDGDMPEGVINTGIDLS